MKDPIDLKAMISHNTIAYRP
jgi:hypothetical protein